MKKLTIAILLAMSTLLTACSQEPGERIESMLKDVSNGQISSAMEAFDPATMNSISDDIKQKMRASFGRGTEFSNKHHGVSKVETTSEVSGELAKVNAVITYGDGKTEKASFRMNKVDGKWYVLPN